MKKVALFDFCETLADFQTADAFVDYVREVTKNKRMIRLQRLQNLLKKWKIIFALSILFPNASLNKRIKLYQLKGVSRYELEQHAKDYYLKRIRPHLITPIVKELQSLQKQGYEVGLVSGGYSIYLKYFVDEFGLDFCLSSEIKFRSNICSGCLDGYDCLGNNKIIRLKERYNTRPEVSLAFSDSRSDLPLLQWVQTGIVVSRGKHQEWIDKYNLKEIIWQI